MRHVSIRLTIAALFFAVASAEASAATATVYDIDFTAINGDPMPLSAFEGKALLVAGPGDQNGLLKNSDSPIRRTSPNSRS